MPLLIHSHTATSSQDSFSVKHLINSRKLRLIFTDPKLRPPVLDEMMPDIDRLAASIARIRSDKTCPALNAEDLVAECNFKLAVLITRDRVETLPNRFEAFKFIKTVYNNHVKSLVSKHRLTLKRGYRRGPVEETDGEEHEISLDVSRKNTDLSADDPDQHMQLADPSSGWTTESSFIEDIAIHLSPVELLVIREYNNPSARTRFFAEFDTMLGKKPGSGTISITFSERNHADGLGIELGQFKRALRSLRDKITWINMNEATPQQISWNQAISRLEEAFDIQIPQSIEKPVVRRLLTMAAVDQFEKVEFSDMVKRDLQFIGAKVPERRSGIVACLGIMFQKNSRTCIACGLAVPCRSEAANYGLGDITIDTKLLGSKQYRVPVVVSNSPEPAQIMSARDEEVYGYLKESFDITQGISEWTFRHRDVGGISVVVQYSPTFEIKFARPSLSMQSKLAKIGNEWFVPQGLTAANIIELIQQHAHEAFVAVTP